jgi:hypothetical protein
MRERPPFRAVKARASGSGLVKARQVLVKAVINGTRTR